MKKICCISGEYAKCLETLVTCTILASAMDMNMEACVNALMLEEIVEHILKCLPIKALNRVASVSKDWHKISCRIKQSRQQIAWLLYSEDDHGGIEYHIGRHLNVIASQPTVALVFCSASLHNKSISVAARNRTTATSSSRPVKREKLSFVAYMRRVLPASCQLLGLVADGVIGTRFDTNTTSELESSSCAAACLLLPQLDGIDIVSFQLPGRDCSAHSNEVNFNNSRNTVSVDHDVVVEKLSNSEVDDVTKMPAHKDVRLVLLLLTEMNAADSEFGHALVRRYGPNSVVIAGGFGDEVISGFTSETLHSDTNNQSSSGLGIAFCGQRLHVTSAIVDADICNPMKVEACLRRLSGSSLLPPSSKNSFGIMFACMGRGRQFYNDETNVESSAFARVFPGVPLIGFFGNGEIGYEFPYVTVAENDSGEASTTTQFPKLYHSYTTIFLLVSLY